MWRRNGEGIMIVIIDLINRQKSEIERLKECPKCVYETEQDIDFQV